MKLTRRELAAVVSATALAAAQTELRGDELQSARDRIKTNGEALARQDVAMSSEPAFQFKV
jgi:hypothetical protein